jgi:rSAM/selenodomain-associated transferase 2
MPVPVSVIIPSLNEEEWIAGAVESAVAADAAEVIVADGGSVDRTTRLAKAAGARILLGDPMRARRLNHAAESASHRSLIFLHADTRLPRDGVAEVENALNEGTIFGGFRLRFAERVRKLRVVERMINLRSTLTHCPWGDQAQFIRRDIFRQLGGFREIPIMEDYDLALRLRRSKRSRLLPLTVVTSGRRFLQKGVFRTATINWKTIARYHLGADVEELARRYRS